MLRYRQRKTRLQLLVDIAEQPGQLLANERIVCGFGRCGRNRKTTTRRTGFRQVKSKRMGVEYLERITQMRRRKRFFYRNMRGFPIMRDRFEIQVMFIAESSINAGAIHLHRFREIVHRGGCIAPPPEGMECLHKRFIRVVGARPA